MAGGYQYCSSCNRIEKNMTIFICPGCNKPYETVSDDNDAEENNSNEKWYIKITFQIHVLNVMRLE